MSKAPELRLRKRQGLVEYDVESGWIQKTVLRI